MPQGSVAAQPGAKRFLSFFSIILVLTMMFIFLLAMNALERDVEQSALQKQVNEINGFLASVIYQQAVLGELHQLADLDYGNPFSLVQDEGGISNYSGVIETKFDATNEGQWYFVKSDRSLYYHPVHMQTGYSFNLRFRFLDVNGDGLYRPQTDRLNGLRLEPVE
jgi:hypothetical protein